MKLSILCSITLALGSAGAPVFAAQPHVHGAGALQLVLEGSQLHAELRLPAINVVGFEHTPRQPRHRQAVQKAAALLKEPDQVLALPEAAQCAAASVTVESELLDSSHSAATPEKPAHEHGEKEQHADFEAVYRFDCRQPEALKRIRFALFKQLPHLEQLDVNSVTATGQQHQRLTPQQDTLTLP